MRLVYLILAHRRPELVHGLVDTLGSHDSVGIYLHVDPRADLKSFTSAVAGQDLQIVRPRVRANWGSYGIVRATLSGLRFIVERERGPYYFVLLSGQDFPIKPIPAIERFFAETRSSAQTQYGRMGTPEGKETDRYTRYFLHNQFHVRGAWRFEKFLNRHLRRRGFPAGFEPYSGFQWWSASHDVIRYIVDFTEEHKSFRRFFWFSNCPDEMFFQTIIMNSPFADRVLNDDLRFTEWPEGAWSPRLLTQSDIPTLLGSPALFARKFEDVEVTKEIARRLKIQAQR